MFESPPSTVTARSSTGRAAPAASCTRSRSATGIRVWSQAGRCATVGRRSSSSCWGAQYRPYKQILAESVRLWVAERGYRWDDADGEAIVRAIRSWQPFPDTRPALLQARAQGLRLVIISNTDRDIIEHTLRHLAVPFDAIIV